MLSAVVFGIGNPLRGDDAFGWRVADGLVAHPGVEVVACIQLMPEHTDVIRQARRVVFVDIDQRLAPGASRFLFIRPVTARPGALGHHLGPAELLGFTRLYFGGASPVAWLAGVGGQELELGQRLSAEVAPAVTRVTAQLNRALEHWITQDRPRPDR